MSASSHFTSSENDEREERCVWELYQIISSLTSLTTTLHIDQLISIASATAVIQAKPSLISNIGLSSSLCITMLAATVTVPVTSVGTIMMITVKYKHLKFNG